MSIEPFKLEEFWKKHEFTAPYLLCSSDAESWTLEELLAMADSDSKSFWNLLSLGYTQPSGHPLLREEISYLYSSIDSENVFTFAGAQEGIYCSMRVLVQPGDHVIVVNPCYQSLLTLPKTLGAEITSIELVESNQWKLNLKEIEKAFRPTTKLVVLNYPHNPTGILLDRDVLDGIIELARKRGTYIFCDEVYRYLEVDETLRLPSVADLYERGISLNVMTKSFGLAGLRIGWIASCDGNFLNQVGSYKLYSSICNSASSEILAIMALRAKEKIFKRNREIMLNNLELLDAFMKRHQDKLSWVRPQSGTIALLKLLLPISVEDFADDLIQAEGVLIMPGSVFDLSGPFFRIGFGKKNMADILKRFESYLQNKSQNKA